MNPHPFIKTINQLKCIIFICFLGCVSTFSYAQNTKWIQYQEGDFELDSLSVIPESIQIQSSDPELQIIYDINQNKAKFSKKLNPGDSVKISYKTLPFNIAKTNFNRNPILYDSAKFFNDEVYATTENIFEEKREEIFKTDGLNKTGTISRGISFGNTQNIFVNSLLNLQLDGNINKDIRIKAVISDQNIPFQPDGNTQQLQEFDKVFVQLIHKNGTLTAGDIVLKNPENYFLKYYKNVQGGSLETNYLFSPNSKASTNFAISISKGKFASITIPQLEGVQGPYRITGPNNESFIIVLANSEKVFLDGTLLKRGFNNDYVIDYNLGEIIFNNGIIITKFSRIRVDFEYSDRNYTRTILSGSHYQYFGKTKVYGNFYQEADNPQNPRGLSLSDDDKRILNQAGNNPLLAIIDGVDSVSFQENLVLYRKLDTTINSLIYKDVYVYSSNPSNAFYRLAFTNVGQNKGDYIQERSTINGQVYKWVEPINGIPQGTFAPVRVIPTPAKKQLYNLGFEYLSAKNDKIFGEVAFSEKDPNLFSSLENSENKGLAYKVGYENTGKDISFLPNFQWIGSLNYESNSRYFNPIDRFRAIEFDRDWVLNAADTARYDDNILNFIIGIKRIFIAPKVAKVDTLQVQAAQVLEDLQPFSVRVEDIQQPIYQIKNLNDHLTYRFTWRDKGALVNGWQQEADLFKQIKWFQFKANAFLLYNNRQQTIAEWTRLNTDVSFHTKKLVFGHQFNLDKNNIKNAGSDSIIATLMNFEENRIYIKTPEQSKVQFYADYALRYDNLPVNGIMKLANTSHTTNVRLNTIFRNTQSLGLIFTYRTLTDNLNTALNNLNESNISSRLDWNGYFFKKHIVSELTMASSTGRELRREFIFLPVNNREGTHTWRDDNNDGVQQLNEFYLAINADERNYIKVFVPTNDYIKAFSNNFIYRLNWEAPRTWKKEKGIRGLLGKFSSVSSWSIAKRITDDDLAPRFLAFLESSANSTLSIQEVLRTTLFFNRVSPNYGFDFNFFNAKQRQVLTNGFESREQTEYNLNLRKNLGKNLNLRVGLIQNLVKNESDFLSTRNFEIFSQQIKPELAYQPNRNVRLIGGYSYGAKINLFLKENAEQAYTQQGFFELRWNKLSERNLSAIVRYIYIDYQGEANSPVGYEMLEALKPGKNITWSLNWRQRLTNGLQLTLNYEGRNSEDRPTVHIGRMQISALF